MNASCRFRRFLFAPAQRASHFRLCGGLVILLPVLSFAPISEAARAQNKVFLGKSADQWRQFLNSPDAGVRRSAAFALGKLGAASAGHTLGLLNTLNTDGNATVRQAAAFAIGEICKQSPNKKQLASLLPVLRQKVVKDGDARVRRSAAYALGCIGDKAALPELKQAVTDANPAVRQNAVWALGEIGPDGLKSIQLVLRNDGDAQVLRDAARAAGSLGRLARPAIADLAKLTVHDNVEVKKAALAALAPILNREDAKVAAGPLQQALKDRVTEIRRNAALALGNIGGEAAAPAVPILLNSLLTGTPAHKRQAAAVLGNVGPTARAAVPALRIATKSTDEVLRRNAVSALGGVKSELTVVVPELVAILGASSEKAIVREEAAFALLQIGRQPMYKSKEKEIILWRNRIEILEKEIPKVVRVVADRKQPAQVRFAALMSLHPHGATLVEHDSVMKTLKRIVSSEPKRESRKMLRYDSAFLLGMMLADEVDDDVMNTLYEFLKDNKVQIYGGLTRVSNVPIEIPGTSKLGKLGHSDGRVMAVKALRNIGAEKVGQRKYAPIVHQLRTLLRAKETNKQLREQIAALFEQFEWKE